MLIKCTSCGSQAKIPDSKEGAKVKCPACQHIYVARPAGARGSARGANQDHTSKFIIGGVVLVGLIMVVIFNSGGDEPVVEKKEVVVEKKAAPEPVDPMGWEGPAVLLARSLHAAAFSANETLLTSKLDREAAYKYAPIDEVAGEILEPLAPPAEGETTEPEPRPTWESLDELGRIQTQDSLIEAVMSTLDDGAVRDWEPFDGKVELLRDDLAVVRLRVVCRDASEGLADRYTQWVFKNQGGDYGADDQWRWIHVERWVTAEEAAAGRRGRRVKAKKKILSDGSKVYESTIRPIPFDDDVPAAQRAELTKLVNDLVADIDLPPRKLNPIRQDIDIAGKSAIAPLLTKMAEISGAMSSDMDENETDRIRLNFIHERLEMITDYQTTFAVAVEMGSTQERIESGVKQWYGWYDRKYKRFQVDTGPVADPLLDDPDFRPTTPEEIRLYELAKKERKEELRRQKDGK